MNANATPPEPMRLALSDINLHDIGDTIQLAGAVYADRDQRLLLCLFPDMPAAAELPIVRLEMGASDWERFIRQSDLLETTVVARAKDGTTEKAVWRKSQRNIDQVITWRVFRRDGYACRYCGKDDVPLTVDHIILWEEGGPTIERNLTAACRKCNRVRGRTPIEAWLRHPYYLEVSKDLPPEVKAANNALPGQVAAIPRLPHVRSRG
jgi:5-methylcytosine-specific restriction endonuclease McrA